MIQMSNKNYNKSEFTSTGYSGNTCFLEHSR